MADDRYALSRFHLHFRDDSVESAYRDEAIQATLWFCRAAWILIPVLGGSFGLLDRPVFGANATLVLTVRALLLLVALVVLAATFWPRARPWMVGSSALYILLVGCFSTFLVAMDDRTTMSPYFVSLFFAFAACFTTVGVGFRYSFYALCVTAAGFLLTTAALAPVSAKLILLYSFFTPGIVVVFAYTAYLIERVSRERFVNHEQLRLSLEEVKTLSGLLPICASCKNIRDDMGYWSQIESYISEYSEAVFTHGICPDCATELYGDLATAPDHDDDDESE